MAALGDTGSSLLKAQVRQPPSPPSKSQQQQQQLHNLLQQASTVNHNGSTGVLSPKSGRNGTFDFFSQNFSIENMPPVAKVKQSPSNAGKNRTKSGIYPGSDHPSNGSNGFNDVKIEPTLATTTMASTNKPVMSSSVPSNRDDKKVNNNSVSYTAGGRLKFFKEGRCLLELTHKQTTEGNETWVPVKKNVYWPPPGPVKAESSPSVHSATSEGGSESIPSPFPSSGFGIGGSFPHRVKRRPKFFNGDLLDKTTAHDLLFAMKPPPCIVSLRKRIRNFPRKCRQPHSNIVVAAFLLKIEAEAVKVRPPRRRIIADKKRQELRIENLVAKMTNRAKHVTKKPVINIQSWKSTTTTSQPATTSSKSSTAKINFSNKNLGLAPAPAVTTMRVKSELCPVTETCTAATLPPPSSPSTHAKSSKSKVDSRNVCSTTTSTKTLPITPTIARIKHEPANPIQISQNVTSFMSPDMQRVKVEIGRQYSPTHHMPPTSTSPMNDFASPRKRYLQDFDALSPASKRHRLSTDSRGSAGSEGTTTGMSSNGGNGSPHHFMHPGSVASPPRQAQNNGHRMSSFSIDSIISGSSRDDRVDNGSSAHVSSPKPIKPVPVTPRRSPVTSQPSSQQQQPTTPLVHITPYASRGIDPRTPIDPRLAHLAGVAADPRLGLSPVAASFGYANPYSNFFASHFAANSPFAQLAAATQFAQLAAASGLMRPLPEPSPSLTGSPAPPARTLSLSSANTMTSVQSPSPTPPPVSTAQPTSSFSTWGQQYRGEPRVEAPSKSESRRSDQPMDTGGDLPLNLSLRR